MTNTEILLILLIIYYTTISRYNLNISQNVSIIHEHHNLFLLFLLLFSYFFIIIIKMYFKITRETKKFKYFFYYVIFMSTLKLKLIINSIRIYTFYKLSILFYFNLKINYFCFYYMYINK